MWHAPRRNSQLAVVRSFVRLRRDDDNNNGAGEDHDDAAGRSVSAEVSRLPAERKCKIGLDAPMMMSAQVSQHARSLATGAGSFFRLAAE